jgi:orotate phosphoribosyltransferase-like protein
VSIGVAVGWDSSDERAKRMDLVAEAVAQMGKQLLMARTSLEIQTLLPVGSFRTRVSNMAQLADASVGMWTRQGEDRLQAAILKSDLMIIGPKEFIGNELLAATGGSGLSVLISEKPITSGRLGAAHVFTGKEDLSSVVAEVLQR